MTDTVLIDRIRTALAGETDIREVNMFGGLAFMVREHLLASRLYRQEHPATASRPR